MRRFCPYCGKQITAGAIKCHYCGRILKDIVSQKKEGNESKGEKTEQIESCSISLFDLVTSRYVINTGKWYNVLGGVLWKELFERTYLLEPMLWLLRKNTSGQDN